MNSDRISHELPHHRVTDIVERDDVHLVVQRLRELRSKLETIDVTSDRKIDIRRLSRAARRSRTKQQREPNIAPTRERGAQRRRNIVCAHAERIEAPSPMRNDGARPMRSARRDGVRSRVADDAR